MSEAQRRHLGMLEKQGRYPCRWVSNSSLDECQHVFIPVQCEFGHTIGWRRTQATTLGLHKACQAEYGSLYGADGLHFDTNTG